MPSRYPPPQPSPARGEGARCPSRAGLPPHSPGLRIGLFGGSFNPPHPAHRAATLLAMKRLQLDHVWWLVTPGNPLKDVHDLPPLDARIDAARRLARHPRIHVTGVEAALGTRFTCDTLAALVRRCPGVRFVWIMGADNLPEFHRWRNWRAIAGLVPIAVVDRAAAGLNAIAGIAPQALAAARIPEFAAAALPMRRPPAWVSLHGLKSPISSTRLRQKIKQPAG
ncbi:MAG: nicotinate-nucleotide adenylyltransferase [Rhizobiales bacterium]|nr:nicotinate-nucleotide adenylyltransferase [Hyphomicrobiales bacterium]